VLAAGISALEVAADHQQRPTTLFGIARRILGDPGLAEYVLQNALVTIWRKLPHLREPDRFEAWDHAPGMNRLNAR